MQDQTRARAEALVVFTDQPGTPWLRLLKPGFRHCFVVLRDGGSWLVCDPLKHRIALRVLTPPADFDLAAFYARRGYRVCKGELQHPAPSSLDVFPAPLTCVSVAKHILGVQAPAILTPWRLYAHLLRTARPRFAPCTAARSGRSDRSEPVSA